MEYVICNLCKKDYSKIIFSKGMYNIVRCKKCGLIYQNPRPTVVEIIEFFSSLKLPHKFIGYGKRKLFEKSLKYIEKILNIQNKTEERKILDIGTGDGTFLKIAKNKKWKIYGTELSKILADYASKILGIKIFTDTLKKINFASNYFDVVTLWDVIDLLTDPLDELLEVNRILKKGGLVVIRARNSVFHLSLRKFSFLFDLLKLRPTIFLLYAFSSETIKKMLKVAGFEVIKTENSELTLNGFPVFGINFIKKIVYILSWIVYFLSFKRSIIGSSLLVYARKK